MNKHCNVVVPALLALLLAGCGGSADNTAAARLASPNRLAGSTAAGVAAAAATTWTSVKWGGGGYVTGLIYHPTSANVQYARTDIGGAYRWNQANSSWTPITDGIGFGAAEARYHGVESIALDPTNDQLVYMVTGMYTFEGNGRLYRSSDRGDHWTHVDLPFPVGGNNSGRAIGERLKVDPTNPSTLFYGSRTAGLWKSTDSGQTWNQVTSLSSVKLTQDQVNALGGSAMGVEALMFDNSSVGGGQPTWIMWAAIAPDYANAAGLSSTLYKSTNGGYSWTPVAVPSQVAGYYMPHIVRTNDGAFYVVFNKHAGEGASGPAYLYKFGGSYNNTWTLLNSSSSAGYGGVSVSGTGATARIALSVTGWNNTSQALQLSDNGGASWREIEVGMPHNPNETASGWLDDVEIDPSNRDHISHVYGGGVWETRNASAASPTWNLSVTNLEETATLAVVTPPAGTPYKFINSAGDIGTWLQTDLAVRPTKGPNSNWSNGNAADLAWSDPLYIAGTGVANWSGAGGFGFWSGDGGSTWNNFASLPAGAQANTSHTGNIAVTSRNNAVWAPANSVPSYTTNSGASWTATNLPALPVVGQGWDRGYRLAADRNNPNKVYAYDSGGASWATAGKVYVSTDGGHTFTLSQGSVAANLAPNAWGDTSMAVNPNAEGDIWLADGSAVYHSVNSGASWTRINNFAPANGIAGASVIALGKAASGASYSAAVYVVGVINGVWGVYRSDDAGASWTRFNDDAHQFGGIGVMAADWNTYGRIYVSGTGRGLFYTN
ncbi:dockerin [Duganella sp.]|uniref:dockerin n=1 Tax=Duganella sp. TaxID=1904440 RepID=UPI0031D9FACF